MRILSSQRPRLTGPRLQTKVMSRILLASVFMSGLLCGCSDLGLPRIPLPSPRDLPFIHKIDVQQGNVINQEMISQLQPGMDKKKVQFVMGTPIIQDTFNPERWDYIYTFKPGGEGTERRVITLVFADDKLDHIEGNVKAAAGVLVADLHQDTTVNVPRWRKPTLATRLKSTLPFVDNGGLMESAPDRKADSEDVSSGLQVSDEEPVNKETPYDNIQAAPGEGVVVPPDAPTFKKKKGFFGGIADSLGIGRDEEDATVEQAAARDPRYGDVKDPNTR